jgi:hypothetical protein
VISSSQRPLPDNTQHSQQTDIQIRTHDPSKRAAEDPRLRPHGHWDRLTIAVIPSKLQKTEQPRRYNDQLWARWSRVRIPVGQSAFLFSRTSIPALWLTESPIKWAPGFFPGGKAAGACYSPHLVPRLRVNGTIPLTK